MAWLSTSFAILYQHAMPHVAIVEGQANCCPVGMATTSSEAAAFQASVTSVLMDSVPNCGGRLQDARGAAAAAAMPVWAPRSAAGAALQACQYTITVLVCTACSTDDTLPGPCAVLLVRQLCAAVLRAYVMKLQRLMGACIP